jgi:hypothetical protein
MRTDTVAGQLATRFSLAGRRVQCSREPLPFELVIHDNVTGSRCRYACEHSGLLFCRFA